MKINDANETKAAQTAMQLKPELEPELDPELEQVLADFRSSVHAWSEARISRSRPVAEMLYRPFWRPAVAWAMAAVLAVGGLSGGLYQRHRHQQVVAALAAEHMRQLEEQRARAEEEKLLARVDTDVSRQVPKAMEPLAQLMDQEDWQ